jgi:hypothetical protein
VGKVIPRMVSEKGSPWDVAGLLGSGTSSCEENESALAMGACLPIVDGFLRSTDLGLSTVDAEDPETKDGVLVFAFGSVFKFRVE